MSPWSPAGLRAIAVGALRAAGQDRVIGLGAEAAFFSLLAFPPTLLALFGSLAYVGDLLGPTAIESIRDSVLDAAGTFLGADALETVGNAIDGFLMERRGGFALLGLVLALWSASRATRVYIDAVNIAYDATDRRPRIRRRFVALGLTALAILTLLVVLPLVVAGPRLGEWIGAPLGLGDAFAAVWRLLYWPSVGVLGVLLVAGFYHLALARVTPWIRDLPGAVFAAVAWLTGGGALRLYARISIEGRTEYGPLGAPIVILLFLYLTALALLMGAEINAQIEKLWPTEDKPEAKTRSSST